MVFTCSAYDHLRQGEYTYLFPRLSVDMAPAGDSDMVGFLQPQTPITSRVAAFITACRLVREHRLSTAMQQQQQQLQQQPMMPISNSMHTAGGEDSIVSSLGGMMIAVYGSVLAGTSPKTCNHSHRGTA